MSVDRLRADLDVEIGFRRAHEVRGVAAPSALRELLAFRLAKEEYAVDIAAVGEIVKPRAVTEVPFAPAFCPGIVSLRGRIVTIMDLRRRLGLPAGELGRGARIVVAHDAGRTVGLLVDGVTGVVRLPAGAVEPVPVVVGGVDGEFLHGLGRIDGRLLILLNLPRVLEFVVE
jgi:purine-binding chemotaxis protein CheW